MSFLVYLGLGHVVAWALLYQHPAFWARTDNKAIRENGSLNSLHDLFHRQRTSWRLGFVGLVSLVCSLPAWGHWGVLATSFLVLVVLGWGLFGVRFNPLLSLARGLPQWYVSFADDCADFPDAFLVRRARAKYPDASVTKQQFYAGVLLQHYSEGAELALCVGYGLAVAVGVIYFP